MIAVTLRLRFAARGPGLGYALRLLATTFTVKYDLYLTTRYASHTQVYRSLADKLIKLTVRILKSAYLLLSTIIQ